MKLDEIGITPPRDEYNDEFTHYFNNAEIVDIIHSYQLKKHVDEWGDIMYGLFDPKTNLLISYLHLEKEPNYYRVGLPSTRPEYRRQGWATYLYDYAVLKDKLKIASDQNQTPEAKQLWKSLARNSRYKIFMFDLKTGKKIPYNGTNAPWAIKNVKNIILITEQHSSEELALFESWSCQRGVRAGRRKSGKWDHLFGPGTSSALFWNP